MGAARAGSDGKEFGTLNDVHFFTVAKERRGLQPAEERGPFYVEEGDYNMNEKIEQQEGECAIVQMIWDFCQAT